MSYVHLGAPTTYNGTGEEGGNPTFVNLNQWYTQGDTAFIILASCLVFLMVPGIALLYAGLVRRKSALQQLFVGMMVYSLVCFQWWFWGYSLAYSTTADNNFIGNLHHFALRHVIAGPSQGSPLISTLLYSFFQMQFAAVTTALVCGAVAERGRTAPVLLFAFCWTTIVYCPLAYWVWNANGWAFKWGILDFAGGGPVEIASGMSAVAYSQVLGNRNNHGMSWYRPHNLSMVMTGTFLLMFGWIGFNGGSAFGANLRAVYASWNTFLTAAIAAFVWVLLDYRLTHKLSLIGWCSGTISGLVAATPASGFIPLWASVVLGAITGFTCNFATKIKHILKIDDSLDVFAEHAVGGMLGLIANGFFARGHIIALDGVNSEMTGGGIDGQWVMLGKQIAYILACAAYSWGVTLVLAMAIDRIPGMYLRASPTAEWLGMDEDQHQEFAYDYVEIRRDYLAWGNAESAAQPQVGIPAHQPIVNTINANDELMERFRAEPTLLEKIIGPEDPERLAHSRYNRHLRKQHKRGLKDTVKEMFAPEQPVRPGSVNKESVSTGSATNTSPVIPQEQEQAEQLAGGEKVASAATGVSADPDRKEERARAEEAAMVVDPTQISAASNDMPPQGSRQRPQDH